MRTIVTARTITDLQKRRVAIRKAIEQYGYRLQEIDDHPGLHYSSISRTVKGER